MVNICVTNFESKILSELKLNRCRGLLVQWKNTCFVIFRARADRGSKHAVDFYLFRCESFYVSHSSLTENFRHTDMSIYHATSNSEDCCDNLPLYEEERSLENRSYDVTAVRTMTSYTLLRNSTTTLAT